MMKPLDIIEKAGSLDAFGLLGKIIKYIYNLSKTNKKKISE